LDERIRETYNKNKSKANKKDMNYIGRAMRETVTVGIFGGELSAAFNVNTESDLRAIRLDLLTQPCTIPRITHYKMSIWLRRKMEGRENENELGRGRRVRGSEGLDGLSPRHAEEAIERRTLVRFEKTVMHLNEEEMLKLLRSEQVPVSKNERLALSSASKMKTNTIIHRRRSRRVIKTDGWSLEARKSVEERFLRDFLHHEEDVRHSTHGNGAKRDKRFISSWKNIGH